MTRGQDGIATPFLYDSFIHNSTPVYPGALSNLLEQEGCIRNRSTHRPDAVQDHANAGPTQLVAMSPYVGFKPPMPLLISASMSGKDGQARQSF